MRELSPSRLNRLTEAFLSDDSTRAAKGICTAVRNGQDVLGMTREHPLGDDMADFFRAAAAAHFQKARGCVYLATGPAHAGLMKLGKTAKNPSERIASLNNAAVLLPLRLVFALRVHDRHWVEAQAHRLLKSRGVAHVKEFFDEGALVLTPLLQQIHLEDVERFKAAGFTVSTDLVAPSPLPQ